MICFTYKRSRKIEWACLLCRQEWVFPSPHAFLVTPWAGATLLGFNDVIPPLQCFFKLGPVQGVLHTRTHKALRAGQWLVDIISDFRESNTSSRNSHISYSQIPQMLIFLTFDFFSTLCMHAYIHTYIHMCKHAHIHMFWNYLKVSCRLSWY